MENALLHRKTMASPWTPFGLSVLLLTLVGCNGNDAPKPMPGTPVAPAAAPSISSVAPADASPAVALAVQPSAVFDQPMNALGQGNFTLMQGTTQVPGTVSTSADGLTATFAPSSLLVPGTAFTATITAGAMSSAGTALAANHSWSFTTVAPANPVAPLISSVTPADASQAVAVATQPYAVFDQPMIALGQGNFTLMQGTTKVPGTVSTSADGLTATFAPSSWLVPGSLFTATITAGAMSAGGTALAANHVWSFTTVGTANLTPPTVSSTSPAASTPGVDPNATLVATFSKVMDPLTITAASFTLKQAGTPVTGVLGFGIDGATVTFAPTSPLAGSTTYTAALSTSVKDQSGLALAAPFSWSFTTAAASAISPTITVTNPINNASGVALNASVTANFSKAMDVTTITGSTFTLKQGTVPVAGKVVAGPGNSATFTPLPGALTASTLYTATLSTGVKDLQGDALTAPFAWAFTTGALAAKGPAVVNLGTAGNYAILAKTGVSTVPASTVTGDIGLSPAAASFLTGFSLTADSTNVFSTSPQIVGQAFAANYAVPTPTNLTTAVSDMQTAYVDAASRPTPDFLNLEAGNIGGLTLAPGLYHWTSSVTIPTSVTINGGANDVWIFQTTGDLTQSSATNIILSGGAQAKNIFWQIAGQVTVGTGAHFEGTMLCKTQVTLQTGATMNGRILAQTLVALQQATVTQK